MALQAGSMRWLIHLPLVFMMPRIVFDTTLGANWKGFQQIVDQLLFQSMNVSGNRWNRKPDAAICPPTVIAY
jgi:hypothetical protein